MMKGWGLGASPLFPSLNLHALSSPVTQPKFCMPPIYLFFLKKIPFCCFSSATWDWVAVPFSRRTSLLIWTWAWEPKLKIACKGSSASAIWAWLSSSNYHPAGGICPGPHHLLARQDSLITIDPGRPQSELSLIPRTGVPWVLRQNDFWFLWPCVVESVRWSNRVRQSKCPALLATV